MKKIFSILCLVFLMAVPALAQNVTVKGVVVGSDNLPLPGVFVVANTTSQTVSTGLDGDFSLTVPTGTVLTFSYIGYLSQTYNVVGNATVTITMEEDLQQLEEIVVIGYGTQKKSVVTAAIASVSNKDLEKVAPVRVDAALKGLAAGVMVTSQSGQPGEASRVRIRGIGTINNSDPLYIVDGMPIDGGIDFLNPQDISSIEVLKDAASGAVYGSRAANGVILVTTKQGNKGQARLTYDFSYGLQNPWKERDVLDATQYAILMNEGYLAQGNLAALYNDPYAYGKGTNWQKETFNYNAPVMNHQLGLSGGNNVVSYYLSGGYYKQEGIVGGNFGRSNYDRLTLRTNTLYNILDASKERNFLHTVKAGLNVAYTNVHSTGIATNTEFGSVLGSALGMSPILSVLAPNQSEVAAQYPEGVKDANGQYYTIPGATYNELTNPLATLSLPGDKNWSHKLVSSAFVELGIWDNLKFKSSVGIDLSFWGADGWTPIYYLGQSNKATYSSVHSSTNQSLVWQVENTLSYEKQWGDHFLAVVLGQSAKETTGRYLGGSNQDMIEERADKANIAFTTGTQADGKMNVYGSAYSPYRLMSYFGRISYNYKERYMAQVTLRRDGSSNFGPGKRFALFPSASLGWNLTNEPFMDSRPQWLSLIKARASWGKNGNESIGQFGYTVLTSSGNNYIFGTGAGTRYNGTKPAGLANDLLAWEESVQTNVGLDFGFFNNALTFTVDAYQKITNGMLMTMPIPSYVGESKPTGNVGIMKNRGIELEGAFRRSFGQFNLRVGGNISFLKNTLVDLGNDVGYMNYDWYQNVGNVSRAENGMQYPFFYGYQSNGIFQTKEEINAYTHINEDGEAVLIQPKAQPGDVIFIDQNNDGVINDDDKVMIGKGTPDFVYGFHVAFDWKGIDFSMMWQGTYGNDIFDATRRTDVVYMNQPSYMFQRWTGPGTSNTIPRFSFTNENGNWLASDLFVKDGSYLRLKNIQLGYTLPQHITRHAFISTLRLYVAAENLLTFTRYEGFDPEIANGTSLGIDKGIYPQARVYTFGVTIGF